MDLAPTTAGLIKALTVSWPAPPELIRLDGELVQAWSALKAAQQAMTDARRAIERATKALDEYERRTT